MLRSAPSRPRSGPPRHLGGPAQVPGLCLAQTRLDRAGPSRLRSGPSERCISPSWTGGTMERPASGWSGGIRMERWESAMGRWHYYWPQAPDRPSGCRSGPLGQPSGVGQPTRSLGRLAGPQNRILTRNTRPANSSPRLISQAVLAARRLPTRRRGPHESFKDAPEAPVRCRAPPRGVGSPLPLPEMGSRVRRGDGIAG